MSLDVDEIVKLIRPVKDLAGDAAWRAALGRLGDGGDQQDAAGSIDDVWVPPEGYVIKSPEWTSIQNAAEDSGWDEQTVRKYRRKYGVQLPNRQWFIFREQFDRVLPKKPKLSSQ